MRYILRVDLEVEAEDQDAAGQMVNKLIEFANDVIEPEHYQWRIAQLDDGLDDPDLEKIMRQSIMVG